VDDAKPISGRVTQASGYGDRRAPEPQKRGGFDLARPYQHRVARQYPIRGGLNRNSLEFRYVRICTIWPDECVGVVEPVPRAEDIPLAIILRIF